MLAHHSNLDGDEITYCAFHPQNRLKILHGGTIASMVDLGGSLAVASRGLFATGVSTDLNVTYLNSGGKIGDIIRAEVTCDKCEYLHTHYYWCLHIRQRLG